jgi:hypothetical protein
VNPLGETECILTVAAAAMREPLKSPPEPSGGGRLAGMEFSYKIKEAEYRQAWKLRKKSIFSRVQKGIFLFVGFWAFLLICLMLLWGAVQSTTPPSIAAQHPQHQPVSIVHLLGGLALNVGPFFALFGIWAFVKFRQGPVSWRRSYRNDPLMQGEFAASIMPDFISIRNSVGTSSRSGWSIFEYWREKKDVILLVFRTGEFSILGPTGLSEAQRDELRAILTVALPKRQ